MYFELRSWIKEIREQYSDEDVPPSDLFDESIPDTWLAQTAEMEVQRDTVPSAHTATKVSNLFLSAYVLPEILCIQVSLFCSWKVPTCINAITCSLNYRWTLMA